MKKIFALLILIGIMMIFTFGCVQQTEKIQKPIEEIIFVENVTNETATLPTNETNKTITEIPTEQCEESKVYSIKCLDNANIEEEVCVSGKLENKTVPCETNYLCSDSICKPDPTKCIESDNGDDKDTFGTVIFNNTKSTDYCVLGDIIEYYCANGKVQGSRDSCPPTTHCVNGGCEYWEPTCNKNVNTVRIDNHTGYFFSKTDYCEDYEKLVRYTCGPNGSVTTNEITCASDEWCVNSTKTCEKKKCTNDYNLIIAMDTSVPNGIYCGDGFCADYCIDSISIKEFYCDGKTVKNQTRICPTYYNCTDTLINRTNTDTNLSNEFYAAYCKFTNN